MTMENGTMKVSVTFHFNTYEEAIVATDALKRFVNANRTAPVAGKDKTPTTVVTKKVGKNERI